MSIIKFAHLVELNKATISKIEKGGNCEKETLEKIAMGLGETADTLYSYLNPYSVKAAPLHASACPDNKAEHNSYHEMLEDVLHCPEARIRDAVIFGLESAHQRMVPENKPKRKLSNT